MLGGAVVLRVSTAFVGAVCRADTKRQLKKSILKGTMNVGNACGQLLDRLMKSSLLHLRFRPGLSGEVDLCAKAAA